MPMTRTACIFVAMADVDWPAAEARVETSAKRVACVVFDGDVLGSSPVAGRIQTSMPET